MFAAQAPDQKMRFTRKQTSFFGDSSVSPTKFKKQMSSDTFDAEKPSIEASTSGVKNQIDVSHIQEEEKSHYSYQTED